MVTNLDSFGGNSGAAVFNASTLEVEGILVRGDRDYHYSKERKCDVVNVNSETGGRGEDAILISNVTKLLDLKIK